jgi:uncharacterized membrane protein YhaH (DUF805 family)
MTTPYPQGTDHGYPGGGGQGGTVSVAYLRGVPVTFGQAVSEGLRHVFTFQGRASRSAFWWFILFTLIAQFVIDMIVGIATNNTQSVDSTLGFISVLLTLSLAVRRLHDSNHSGWWWLIGFVPLVGWIILLFFYVKRGTRCPNRYDLA